MIKFVTDIEKEKLRMAYNNDILRFYSDAANPAQYADLVLTEDNLFQLENVEPKQFFSIRLYPNPQGQFYVNLQPYAAAALNTRNFEDKLAPAPEAGSTASFVYNYNDGTLLTGTLTISIAHSDDTITKSRYALTWLAGVQQHGEYSRLLKTPSCCFRLRERTTPMNGP